MKRYVFVVTLLAAITALGQAVLIKSSKTTTLLDVVTNGVDAGSGGATNGLMCMGSDGTTARSTLMDSSGRQSVNVAQINGVTTLMGNGVTGTGSQRVTIASDNTAFAVNATCSQSTATSLKAEVIGTKTTNAAAPGATNVGALVAVANAAAPTLIETYLAGLSVDLAGNLRTNTAQINGVTTLMGNGVTGTGSQRVTIASDNTTFAVGKLSNNAAAPAATANVGALVAVANAAAPTYTETYLATQSVDLFGQQRILPAPMNLDTTVVADYTNCAAAGCTQDDGGTPIAAGAYFVTVADETATVCYAATCATGGRRFPIGRYLIRLPALTNISGRSTSSTSDIQFTRLTQ